MWRFLQFQIQGVDNFFQRLYLVCNGEVVLFERLICHVQCFQQSITQGTQFLCGIAGEVQPLFVEFVCRFHDIHRMVTQFARKLPMQCSTFRNCPAVLGERLCLLMRTR